MKVRPTTLTALRSEVGPRSSMSRWVEPRGRRVSAAHSPTYLPTDQSIHKLSHFGLGTVGEITIRRQKPLVLRIMVEQGRTRILFLSELTPRCEQIFPHRCCFQPDRRIRQQCRVQ